MQEAYAVEHFLPVVGAAAALPPGAPAWAVVMNNNVINMNNNLTAQIANVEARQINMVASEHNDPIVAITVPGVPVPVGATWRELLALTGTMSAISEILQLASKSHEFAQQSTTQISWGPSSKKVKIGQMDGLDNRSSGSLCHHDTCPWNQKQNRQRSVWSQ